MTFTYMSPSPKENAYLKLSLDEFDGSECRISNFPCVY